MAFVISQWASVDSRFKSNIEALKARTVKAWGNAPGPMPCEFKSAEGAHYSCERDLIR